MLANIIIDIIVDIDGSKKCIENRRSSAELQQQLPANTYKYCEYHLIATNTNKYSQILPNTAKQDKVCWR